MNNQKGFTLIELVIVIIILAILSAVAVPKMLNLHQEAHFSKVKAVRGSLKVGIVMANAKCEANEWAGTTVNFDNDAATEINFNASCWPNYDTAGTTGGNDPTRLATIFNELIDEDVRAANTVTTEEFDTANGGVFTYQKGSVAYTFTYDDATGSVTTVQ